MIKAILDKFVCDVIIFSNHLALGDALASGQFNGHTISIVLDNTASPTDKEPEYGRPCPKGYQIAETLRTYLQTTNNITVKHLIMATGEISGDNFIDSSTGTAYLASQIPGIDTALRKPYDPVEFGNALGLERKAQLARTPPTYTGGGGGGVLGDNGRLTHKSAASRQH